MVALAVGLFATACSDDGSGGFVRGNDLVVTVIPNPVTFGTVVAGDTSKQVVRIRHDGVDGTLKLRSVTLDTLSSELEITQPEVTELSPGESTTLTVTYRPVDDDKDSGVIFIETNIAAVTGGTLTIEVPVETLTSAGVIRAIPNPVNFGAVDLGVPKTRNVTMVNIGSSDATITAINLSAGTDGDFSIVDQPTLPATYAPDESFVIEVAYGPNNTGGDTGRIELAVEVDGEPRTTDPVTLTGTGEGPYMVAFPNPIDFGWRQIEATHKIPLTLSNQGGRPLVISSLELSEASSDTLTISGLPSSALSIDPQGGTLSFIVEFTPQSEMTVTTGPIGAVVVTSNDPASGGVQEINVFGRPEAPALQVNPPELVEFGFVAQNLSTSRRITLYNAGAADLNVNAITLTNDGGGEFAILEDNSWGPLSGSPSAGVIAPGDYREVSVRFTNNGADTGQQSGVLLIDSNDGAMPMWSVDLKAQRAGSPTCEIQLVPGQLDFGTVPRGHKKTMTANVVNVGSGNCSFHSALVNDCASFFGFFGGTCPDPTTTPQQNGNSNYYSIARTPPAIQEGLRPGQSEPVEITFTPPDTASLFGDELVDYGAYLGIRIIDPYTGSFDPVLFPGPQPGLGGMTYTPNLHAKSGIANLTVLPQEVDFGLVTIGCKSQTFTVTAYNVGTAPLDLTEVELMGCSPEFRIKSLPGLPQTMQSDAAIEVEVQYIPQDEGGDSCGLGFYTDSDTPTIVVPLDGGGTFETEQTDEFIQSTGQSVDVLFVVDDSGSMGDEQSNLSSNFQSFIGGAATWNNDYHVGVTSTDLDSRGGRLMGSPRYVDSSNWQAFESNVRVGTNGSGTEQGMAAAQQALSLPLVGDSGTACGGDGDCADPDRCVDGVCGGGNRGFLRTDAALEIVFVSDEEDQSPGDLNFYINFFKNIKGFYNDNLMHVHAIVGPIGGCSNSYGSAGEGRRYMDVANATGGTTTSVCSPTFSAGLASIGDIAFGLRTQFFLTRLAEPSTVEVTVAGAGCTSQGGSNWTYDAVSNSVIFNETGGCMPQPTELLQIHYSTICLLE